MLYSSGGRPATALSPMLGISAPSYTHTSVPSSLRTDLGANCIHFSRRCPSNRSRGSTTWSSTLTRIRSSARIGSPVHPVFTDADVRLPLMGLDVMTTDVVDVPRVHE